VCGKDFNDESKCTKQEKQIFTVEIEEEKPEPEEEPEPEPEPEEEVQEPEPEEEEEEEEEAVASAFVPTFNFDSIPERTAKNEPVKAADKGEDKS
jgi:hypothetical protein